jgi:hypothetical protein
MPWLCWGPRHAIAVPAAAGSFDHRFDQWTRLLRQHVTVVGASTRVRYAEWKTDRAGLVPFTSALSDVSPKVFDAFSKAEKMAFLINAYNAFTIQMVLDSYPIKSIKDAGSLFTSPWKKKFFKLFGRDFTLDDIEHGMLRKDFGDPRIHFAINCASLGCPPLRDEAYTDDGLDSQLDQQAKGFLRDEAHNKIDLTNKKRGLSMIFKWFHEDFEKNGGSVQKFIAKYLSDNAGVQAQLTAGLFQVSYLDYDWNLNQIQEK